MPPPVPLSGRKRGTTNRNIKSQLNRQFFSGAEICGGVTRVLGSLGFTGVLGYQVTQLHREKENLTQQLMSCPDSPPGPPDTLWGQTLDKREKCPALWIANQDRSYLFSPERGTWDQCKSYCISQSAKLLKLESKEELDFITATSFQYSEHRAAGAYYYPFWTGLSYNSGKGMWVWTDNSALFSNLFVLSDPNPQNYEGGDCAYLQGDKVKPGDCGELRFCLCEKQKEIQGKNKLH
ncbi:hypothetical protein Y1Q_0008479 [Alligator mississippiensis]|uniref:C-type lectin domain-containing protein n=1 Tax=Alligator mississippiensis TaxID=8496 RepID=A0A151M1G8_ALLMI|nr:hypothetical protein Y1Q_0008479 [Alligator mississippiensis]